MITFVFMQRLSVVIFVMMAVASCRHFVSPYQKDRERVKELVDTFFAAVNRSDLPKVLSLYEQDAELFPPGRSAISGKAAIDNSYRQLFLNAQPMITNTITEITVGDLWAVVTGNNTGTAKQLRDSTSTTTNVYNKYMILIQKRESGWMIRKMIWNSNLSKSSSELF